MKSLLLILGVTVSILSKNSSSIKGNSQTDTLTTLEISSKYVTECSKEKCLASLTDTFKNYESYVLIYKNNNYWVVDKNRQNYEAILKKYKIARISILEGDVRVSGLSFPKDSRVVIID